MELEDLGLDMDWAEVDILNSIPTPSLLNNSTDGPQQVNDLVGTAVATAYQAQNADNIFNFNEEATSSIMENPPPYVVDDRDLLPKLSADTSASLLNETQSSYHSPSVVGLISEGVASSIQGEDMTGFNHFPLMQNNNLNLMHEQEQHDEHNTSNQLLVPNILANHNFNGINHQPSSYPPLFQQNQVGARARAGAGARNGTLNGQFMTNQSFPLFPLNNHAINPHRVGNSQRLLWAPNQTSNRLLDTRSFQQQNSRLHGTEPLSLGFTSSLPLSSIIMGISGNRKIEGASSQVSNTRESAIARLLRPERAPGLQLQRVAPLSANMITAQGGDRGLSQSSSSRIQPSMPILNILNRTLTSSGPYATLQQNPSLSLYGRGQKEPPRRGRPRKRFEGGEISSSYKRRKASSGTENAGKTPISQGTNRILANQSQEARNANPANPFFVPNPRQFINSMYNPTFESVGVPVDPHLRLSNATSEQHKPATTRF